MSPRFAKHESKSLKTFFIYTGVVVFIVVLSLAIKSYLLIKQSRFDQNHQFILSVEQKNKVEELIIFNPLDSTVTLYKLQGTPVNNSTLEKTLGIVPDAFVNSSSELPLTDMKETIQKIALSYHSLKTNLTIFDAMGLFFASQKTTLNNQKEEGLVVGNDSEKNDRMIKNLFTDEKVFSENVSIQIVNASGVPGVGKRVERALDNLGCNVVAVTSSRKEENSSEIQYYGLETYTLQKLKKLLAFPVTATDKKSIATIVIIVGKDITYSSNFQ